MFRLTGWNVAPTSTQPPIPAGGTMVPASTQSTIPTGGTVVPVSTNDSLKNWNMLSL